MVFRCAPKAPAKLESQLEAALEKRLGLKVEFHVRTADEWRAVIAANPFGDAAKDPGHLLVYVLQGAAGQGQREALQAAITGPETLRADGRHLYMVFPDGMGNSKAAALVDKKLGARDRAQLEHGSETRGPMWSPGV